MIERKTQMRAAKRKRGDVGLESSGVKQKQKEFSEEICVIIVSVSTKGKDQSGKLVMNGGVKDWLILVQLSLVLSA